MTEFKTFRAHARAWLARLHPAELIRLVLLGIALTAVVMLAMSRR